MNQIVEETFDRLLRTSITSENIDLRNVSFIDPYGMLGLLEIGELCMREDVKKKVLLPQSGEVLRYLARMDFFPNAKQYFSFEPMMPSLSAAGTTGSDVLLEITPIERAQDIHDIVGRVQQRAAAILAAHLAYDDRAINGFIVALSEVCQNIIEHSENKGFVGIQKYYYQTMNRNMVRIAVMDIGIGFRASLSQRFTLRSDLEAIEKGVLHGASRHADEGRGHGLAAVRRFVTQWNGKLSVRSGTAKLSLHPGWSRGKSQERNLIPFPGVQINITLPALHSSS